jgi:hypothetical protein
MPTPGVLTLNYVYVWAEITEHPTKSIFGPMCGSLQNVNISVFVVDQKDPFIYNVHIVLIKEHKNA